VRVHAHKRMCMRLSRENEIEVSAHYANCCIYVRGEQARGCIYIPVYSLLARISAPSRVSDDHSIN
jgi:hypothetical protein